MTTRKCGYYQSERSVCLRPPKGYTSTIERGVLDLCRWHTIALTQRDRKPEPCWCEGPGYDGRHCYG